MNTVLMSRMVHIILVLLCLTNPLQAQAAGRGEFPIVYRDEVAFVMIPAAIGDVAGGVAGGVIGIAIGAPVGILLAPAQKESIMYGPLFGGYFLSMAGRVTGGTLVGAPFLAVRKLAKKVSSVLASWEYRLRTPY